MNKNTLYLLTAALLLLGCVKEPDAGTITVDARIGALTKVSYDGAASSFETGDKIAVYAWTGSATAVPAERVVDGVVNTLGNDGKWTPASVMYWKPGSDAHYFLGVSPLRAISDFSADAFALSGIYASDDLLFARKLDGVKPGTGAVALSFEHAMARLTVNVKVRNEFGASPTVGVTIVAKSGATVNYLTGAVTATGDASERSLPALASAPTGYTHSFGGIQVPQDGVRTVMITVGGMAYSYTAGEDIPLKSGRHTTLGLILGKDKLELSGVSVSDWTAGTALSGGDASVTKINGHEFVDMGNGLLWATCNVGAENPWDYGNYYAWGETVPKAEYSWLNYKWMQAGQSDWKHITRYTFADGKTSCIWYDGDTFKGDNGDGVEHKDFASYDYADDAARQNWGGTWRTPTDAEWTWLRDDNNCTWTWTTQNGVNGMLATSKINGNEIFLPAAGYWHESVFVDTGSTARYWSSSLHESNSDDAWIVIFYSGGVAPESRPRNFGLSVRPVLGTPLPALGDLYYSDGTWSPTLVAGKTPIGVIAYLGEDAFTETGTDVGGTPFKGHGLVLCLKEAASRVCWSTVRDDYEFGKNAKVNNADSLKRITNVSGYVNTMTLVAKDDAATKYPAAWQARNYTGLPAPAGTTGWFLPSAQQWVKMQEGLGGLAEGDITWDSWFNNDHSAATAWEKAMAKAGAKGTAYDSVTNVSLSYWSSCEGRFFNEAVSLHIDATGTGSSCGFLWCNDIKTISAYEYCVRPVLAF